MEATVKQVVARLCDLFGFKHNAHFDLRLTPDGRVFFLESNATTIFSRNDDFAVGARYSGIGFEALVLNTVRTYEPK